MCLFKGMEKKIQQEIDHDMIVGNREMIKSLNSQITHVSNILDKLIVQVTALQDVVASINCQLGMTPKQALELLDFAQDQRQKQYNDEMEKAWKEEKARKEIQPKEEDK